MATITVPQRPGSRTFGGSSPTFAVAEYNSTERTTALVNERWRDGSGFLDPELGATVGSYSPQLAALRLRLRDMFSGPISAATGGVAGILSLATDFAPLWVAMPAGLLLGLVASDRILARLGR